MNTKPVQTRSLLEQSTTATAFVPAKPLPATAQSPSPRREISPPAPAESPTSPGAEPSDLLPAPSDELAADLNRLETAARIELDRQEQERLARLRELSRFD